MMTSNNEQQQGEYRASASAPGTSSGRWKADICNTHRTRMATSALNVVLFQALKCPTWYRYWSHPDPENFYGTSTEKSTATGTRQILGKQNYIRHIMKAVL